MGKTGIPYCDETWNVTVGCTPIENGCKFCWAEQLHTQRHLAFNGATLNLPPQYGHPFSTIQLRHDRLEQPLHWKKPRTIFVTSMSDIFHTDVPDEFIDKMFWTIRHCPQHTFFVFTKRYARAAQWQVQHTWPKNVHLYFSASGQEKMEEAWESLEPIPSLRQG